MVAAPPALELRLAIDLLDHLLGEPSQRSVCTTQICTVHVRISIQYGTISIARSNNAVYLRLILTHALVEAPGLVDGQPQRVELVHHQPGGLYGATQPAGVHHVELHIHIHR